MWNWSYFSNPTLSNPSNKNNKIFLSITVRKHYSSYRLLCNNTWKPIIFYMSHNDHTGIVIICSTVILEHLLVTVHNRHVTVLILLILCYSNANAMHTNLIMLFITFLSMDAFSEVPILLETKPLYQILKYLPFKIITEIKVQNKRATIVGR